MLAVVTTRMKTISQRRTPRTGLVIELLAWILLTVVGLFLLVMLMVVL
jgi:hypothetical protein